MFCVDRVDDATTLSPSLIPICLHIHINVCSGPASSTCRPCSRRGSGSTSSCAYTFNVCGAKKGRGDWRRVLIYDDCAGSTHLTMHACAPPHNKQPPLLLVHRVPLRAHHEGPSVLHPMMPLASSTDVQHTKPSVPHRVMVPWCPSNCQSASTQHALAIAVPTNPEPPAPKRTSS